MVGDIAAALNPGMNTTSGPAIIFDQSANSTVDIRPTNDQVPAYPLLALPIILLIMLLVHVWACAKALSRRARERELELRSRGPSAAVPEEEEAVYNHPFLGRHPIVRTSDAEPRRNEIWSPV